MQYVFIWIEWLAIAIIFVAFSATIFRKQERKTQGIVMSVVFALLPGIVFIGFSYFAWWLNVRNVRPSWLMTFCISLSLAYLIGISILFSKAFRQVNGTYAASNWPRLKIGIYLLLAIMINMSTFHLYENHWKSQLEKKLESIKASIAIYLEEPSDPRQNAAPLYRKAVNLLGDNISPWLEKVNDPDFDATSLEAKCFLAKNEEVLTLLHQAVSLPIWHYPFEIENLIDTDGIGITQFKKIAFIFNLEARHYARQGKLEEAMESLSATQKLAMHIYRYPGSILNCVYSKGLEMWAFKGIENTLYDISEKQVQNTLFLPATDEPNSEDILRAINMEEAFCLAYGLKGETSLLESILIWDRFLRKNAELYWYEKPLEWVLEHIYNMFFSQRDLQHYFDTMAQLRIFAEKDCYKAINEAEALMAQSDKGIGDVVGLGEGVSTGLFKFTNYIYAYRRIEKLVFAAFSFYQDTGQYPKKYGDLVPQYLSKIPVDPFDPTGGPLKFKADGLGILFYSNGEDQSDNGGHIQQKIDENCDIVFSLGEKPAKEKSIIEMLQEKNE